MTDDQSFKFDFALQQEWLTNAYQDESNCCFEHEENLDFHDEEIEKDNDSGFFSLKTDGDAYFTIDNTQLVKQEWIERRKFIKSNIKHVTKMFVRDKLHN